MGPSVFHPDTAIVLAIVLSWAIPALSALVARTHVMAGFLTLLIAAVNGFVSQWAAAPDVAHYDWKSALLVALVSFLVAVGGHYGLWKGPLADALVAFPRRRGAPPV